MIKASFLTTTLKDAIAHMLHVIPASTGNAMRALSGPPLPSVKRIFVSFLDFTNVCQHCSLVWETHVRHRHVRTHFKLKVHTDCYKLDRSRSWKRVSWCWPRRWLSDVHVYTVVPITIYTFYSHDAATVILLCLCTEKKKRNILPR